MAFMNPQRGRHMGGNSNSEAQHGNEHGGGNEQGGHGAKPHIFVHSHANGHSVHVFHSDGRHEAHEHGHGEAEAVADRVHQSLGGSAAGEQRPEEEEIGSQTV